MISWFKEHLKNLIDYNKIAKIDKIARRYFVMNAFDGVLATLGILVGSYVVGSDIRVVLSTGIAAGVAMGVSGIWGAYLTERAERQRELLELERATLSKLKGTRISKAQNTAVFVIAIIDGIAPFVAAIIILLPFLVLKLPIQQLYYLSVLAAFLILFLLGVFLGKLSKESLIKTGLVMILAGIVCAGLSYYLLGASHI